MVCHSDNQAVVADLRSRTSKHEGMMHLLRCLVFAEAQAGCALHSVYIDTKANHLADSLSRNDVHYFMSKVPSAAPAPHPVSTPLLDLLLNKGADWTSPTWRQHFRGIFRQGWHRQQ